MPRLSHGAPPLSSSLTRPVALHEQVPVKLVVMRSEIRCARAIGVVSYPHWHDASMDRRASYPGVWKLLVRGPFRARRPILKRGEQMAWKDVGLYYLGPGQTVKVGVFWSAPGDKGPQYIMAHAKKGEPPTELEVREYSKVLDYSIAWTRSDGTYGWDYDSIYYEYCVTVRNLGSFAVLFSLQGGGVK